MSKQWKMLRLQLIISHSTAREVMAGNFCGKSNVSAWNKQFLSKKWTLKNCFSLLINIPIHSEADTNQVVYLIWFWVEGNVRKIKSNKEWVFSHFPGPIWKVSHLSSEDAEDRLFPPRTLTSLLHLWDHNIIIIIQLSFFLTQAPTHTYTP